jgi:hypothetical protein
VAVVVAVHLLQELLTLVVVVGPVVFCQVLQI